MKSGYLACSDQGRVEGSLATWSEGEWGGPRGPQGASSQDTGSPGRLWLDFSTACELSISTPSKTNASSGWPPGPPIYHHLIYIKALSPLIMKTNKKSASIPRQQQAESGWGAGSPRFLPWRSPRTPGPGCEEGLPTGRQISRTLSSQDGGGSRGIPGQQLPRSSGAPLGRSQTPAHSGQPGATCETLAGVVQGNGPGGRAGAAPASPGWRPCGPRVGRQGPRYPCGSCAG